MIFGRWIREERHLPLTEVQSFFGDHEHTLLGFAFETRRSDVDRHAGNFSVKFVTSGCEQYEFHRRVVDLRPGALLLANAGEHYESRVRIPTRAFSLFVPAGDVAAASRVIQATSDSLLDAPNDEVAVPEVTSIAFRPCSRGTATMARLAYVMWRRGPDEELLKELAGDLVAEALAQNLQLPPSSALAGVQRRATRLELIARALRARDYIEDHPDALVPVDELARIACLSKYHFIRVFRELFGTSPVAYSRARRLERARPLLLATSEPKAVARRAGYSSPSTLRRALARSGPPNLNR